MHCVGKFEKYTFSKMTSPSQRIVPLIKGTDFVTWAKVSSFLFIFSSSINPSRILIRHEYQCYRTYVFTDNNCSGLYSLGSQQSFCGNFFFLSFFFCRHSCAYLLYVSSLKWLGSGYQADRKCRLKRYFIFFPLWNCFDNIQNTYCATSCVIWGSQKARLIWRATAVSTLDSNVKHTSWDSNNNTTVR